MAFEPEEIVLWADAELLAVNKPAGLPSLPEGYDAEAPHLIAVLAPAFGQLWVVHRLDRDASGVILLARTPAAHRALSIQFEERTVVKVYHALVVGAPAWEERTVRLPLRADGDRRHRTVVDPQEGKPAVTRFRVLERFGRHTLLEATPETGRAHQIRVHLAAQGLPIVADPLYGDGQALYLSAIKPGYRGSGTPERPLLARLGLHACALTVQHPTTGATLHFGAPYPKDLAATLRQLKKHAGQLS
jgi:RluA family pseudouridine synthase